MTVQTLLSKSDLSSELSTLNEQPRDAAEGFRPYLKAMDTAKYKKFLKMMYFYTLKSEAILKYAAEKAPTPQLKEFFTHMAKEERGHYLLAQEDLRAFGEEIDTTEEMPSEIKAFHDYWYSVGEKNPYGFLGILYVCENVASYLKEDATNVLRNLNLTKKQSRWISVHLEADDDHGRETSELVDEYFPANANIIVEAAQRMCVLWVDIIKSPLTGN